MCSFPSKKFFFLLVMFSKTGTVYSRHLFLPVHCRISYSIIDLFRQLHHLTEKMPSFQWPMSSVFPQCNRDCYHFHISAGDSTFSLSHACDEFFKHLSLNLVTWCKMGHLSYVPQTVFDIADPCSTRPDACLLHKQVLWSSVDRHATSNSNPSFLSFFLPLAYSRRSASLYILDIRVDWW